MQNVEQSAAPRRRFVRQLGAGALLGLGLACGAAQAQAPTPTSGQPLRVIVAFAAGGAADALSRLLGKEMEKSLGQPVIVENRPGAYTFVAVQSLLASKADGHTVMAVSNDTLTVNPHLTSAPYDIQQSFEYVGIFGEYLPALLVARKDFPANDAKELVDHLRANPGRVNFASHGNGSTSHLRMELLLGKLGVKQNHVPYKGAAPALQDLAGGQVDIMVDAPLSAIPQIKAGRIKALANMAKERSTELPEVATLGEVGASAGDFVTFQAFIAPKGVPAAQLERVRESMRKALANPELQAAMRSRGFTPKFRGGDEFQSIVMEGSQMMKKVIADNQIAVQ
jgi:tripartite-type tricarboxylate transporter receptor subunit TctC